MLRTKQFKKIDRYDRYVARKGLRKKGVTEVNYFVSKDIEDEVK